MHTTTRFPLERLAALDRAIRAGQFPNASTLARALEVSPRTVQRDIEFLRTRMNASLVFDARHNGYTYAEPDYQLPLLSLTEGELVAIFLAERVLQQYRGTPYAVDLTRAFAKITAGLTDRITIDLGHLGAAYSFRTSAGTPIDPAIFRSLAAAVAGRRRVVLDYWSASRDERTRREVDPYHLASIDGQWYLVAHCHLRGDVRMFAPGRIRSLEVTEATFEAPTDFRIEGYLAQSFAVLRSGDGDLYRVRLRFTGEAVKYVRERTWHPSQTTEATPEGDLIVGMEVSHLREVERWALSWGADCVVIEPDELRDRVARILAAAVSRYLQSSDGLGKHPDNIDKRTVRKRRGTSTR